MHSYDEVPAALEAYSDDILADKHIDLVMMITIQHANKRLPEQVPQELVDKALVAFESYSKYQAELRRDLKTEGSAAERMADLHLRNIEQAVAFVPRLNISARHPTNAPAVEKSIRRLSLSLAESLSIIDATGLKGFGDFYNRLMVCAEQIVGLHDRDGVHVAMLPAVARQCEVWVTQRDAGKQYGYTI